MAEEISAIEDAVDPKYLKVAESSMRLAGHVTTRLEAEWLAQWE